MTDRSEAPYWRHDAYTLRRLKVALVDCIARIRSRGGLGNDDRVVDLGCGDLPYRQLLSAGGAAYVGCDIDPGPGVDFVIDAQGRVGLPDASATCVASFQVLEHVWDIGRYLDECRRLLGPEGVLVLSTHGTWLYHPHPGDYRRWTLSGLTRELEERGFVVEEVWPVVGPLAWTTQFRTLAYHHLFSRLGIIGRILSSFLCVLMYMRMTVEDRVTPPDLIRDNAAVYLLMARQVHG